MTAPPGAMVGAPATEAVLLIVTIPRLSRSVRSFAGPTVIGYSASKLFAFDPPLRLASPPTKNVPDGEKVCETVFPVVTAEVPSPKFQWMAVGVGPVVTASNETASPALAKTVVVCTFRVG